MSEREPWYHRPRAAARDDACGAERDHFLEEAGRERCSNPGVEHRDGLRLGCKAVRMDRVVAVSRRERRERLCIGLDEGLEDLGEETQDGHRWYLTSAPLEHLRRLDQRRCLAIELEDCELLLRIRHGAKASIDRAPPPPRRRCRPMRASDSTSTGRATARSSLVTTPSREA